MRRILPLLILFWPLLGCGQTTPRVIVLDQKNSNGTCQQSVLVSPQTVTLTSGSMQTFSAPLPCGMAPAVFSCQGGCHAGASLGASTGVYVAGTGPYTEIIFATSGNTSGTAVITVEAPLSVSVSCPSPAASGGTSQCVATVTGGNGNPNATWSLSGCAGSISVGGLVTTPNGPATCTATATSQQDNTTANSAAVSVTAVSISVSPTPVSVLDSGTQQFTASVQNAGNSSVTWSCGGCSGSLNSAGLYTAPASGSHVDTVTATSVQDGSKSASATVIVTAGQAGTAGTTQTQAVITYDANTSNCTIKASLVNDFSGAYVPVNAVSETLFPGSSNDNNTTAGTRGFVLGKRDAALSGFDNQYYSRALQTNTTHYVQISGCGTTTTSLTSSNCVAGTCTGNLTTQNIPFGITFADLLLRDNSAPAAYVFPSTPNVRGYTVIDPLTGVQIRRVTKTATSTGTGGDVASGHHAAFWDAGNDHMCGYTPFNNGFLCGVPDDQRFNWLYWINPADGSSSFLGYLHYEAGSDFQSGYTQIQEGNWDPTNSTIIYDVANSTQTPPQPVLIKFQYTGTTADQPQNTIAAHAPVVNLTPVASGTIPVLVHNYDATFDATKFTGCGIHGIQKSATNNHYIAITSCRRYQQDSEAWLIALDLGATLPPTPGTLNVVAATPMYGNVNQRWCGTHSNYFAGDSEAMYVIPQNINFSHGGHDPYLVTLANPVGPSDSSFVLSTNANGGEPTILGTHLPPDGGNFLQNAANGDMFQFQDGTGEFVRLDTKTDSLHWGVLRHCVAQPGNVLRYSCSGSGSSHAAGATLVTNCEALAKPSAWWRFTADPHGTLDGSYPTNTNTYFIIDTVETGSHPTMREPWFINEGNSIRNGTFPNTSVVGQANQSLTRVDENSPPFAGLSVFAYGNSYQKHPSYDQMTAAAGEKVWYLDAWPFSFNGYDLGTNPHDTVTILDSSDTAGYLYKNTLAANHTIDVAKLPYFATTGTTLLKDISGPASTIDKGVAFNWQFCLVKTAGECRPASQPGDVFFNLPPSAAITSFGCSGGETGSSSGDFCIQHTAAYGQAVNQFGLNAADQISAGPPPSYGAGLSRSLVRGLFGRYKHGALGTNPLDNAHPLPDGSWVLYEYRTPTGVSTVDRVTMAAKIPPQPGVVSDSTRNNFQNVSITIGAGSGGATRARVKYGYEENGLRTNFYCTQRPATCYYKSGTLANETAGNATTFATGAGAQTLAIGIPGRVIFYQVEYSVADNPSFSVVATDPIQAVAIP